MRTVSIGRQDFASLIENNYFYVDKTNFIREWWEGGDAATLITRPRRFGKTLNMSMLECFFSLRYQNRADLFEGLDIWQEEKYRALQGSFPVIFITFANVKSPSYTETTAEIKRIISRVYEQHRYLLEGTLLSENEKKLFRSVTPDMDDGIAKTAISTLSDYLQRCHGKKVIILLDEYDTPLQEAYVDGYWESLSAFTRGLFNDMFKTNASLERGLMTGITRVSKESIFSDLNNLSVITTTGTRYADCFGFTEDEVSQALAEAGMFEELETVKRWYDGFTFGKMQDIYNPWSITNFLKNRSYESYWADTSSNKLVGQLIRHGNSRIKEAMETLLHGEILQTELDEQIIFDQLDRSENAVWSLLLASGYLKVADISLNPYSGRKCYHLALTNFEVKLMFERMISDWFSGQDTRYSDFLQAFLQGDLKSMNAYMQDVAKSTFSSFDTGRHPSRKSDPERFYHGFVLGLLVTLREDYILRSNRESGFGRYDVMLEPLRPGLKAYVLEFKVLDSSEEANLDAAVASALRQIQEKDYDRELLDRGISKKDIVHYGFAFEGKRVKIGGAFHF